MVWNVARRLRLFPSGIWREVLFISKSRFKLGWCLSGFLHGQPSLHPSLLAIGIVRHVGVTHRHQFTGSVCAGVSMEIGAVGDDLGVLVRQ